MHRGRGWWVAPVFSSVRTRAKESAAPAETPPPSLGTPLPRPSALPQHPNTSQGTAHPAPQTPAIRGAPRPDPQPLPLHTWHPSLCRWGSCLFWAGRAGSFGGAGRGRFSWSCRHRAGPHLATRWRLPISLLGSLTSPTLAGSICTHPSLPKPAHPSPPRGGSSGLSSGSGPSSPHPPTPTPTSGPKAQVGCQPAGQDGVLGPPPPAPLSAPVLGRLHEAHPGSVLSRPRGPWLSAPGEEGPPLTPLPVPVLPSAPGVLSAINTRSRCKGQCQLFPGAGSGTRGQAASSR